MTTPFFSAFSGLAKTLLTNRYLFLISHMRSNSTLLSHILGSNPGIVGYREMHIGYRSQRDFLRLKYRLREEAADSKPIYLLDKILHNNLSIAPGFLASHRLRYLVTIREPERTIKSIVTMASKNGNTRYDTAEKAGTYYVDRLNGLLEIGRHIPSEKAIFFPSDAIVKDTDRTIAALQDWLELPTNLSAEYQIYEHTGKRFAGDPSVNITSGKVCEQDANAYADIKVDPYILETARQKHDEALSELSAKFSKG